MVRTGTLVELINFNLPAGAGFLWLKRDRIHKLSSMVLATLRLFRSLQSRSETHARTHRVSSRRHWPPGGHLRHLLPGLTSNLTSAREQAASGESLHRLDQVPSRFGTSRGSVSLPD
jgi:hypothetical protein